MPEGCLVIVGLGLHPGQCTLEAREALVGADIVFAQAGEADMLAWVRTLNANTHSLQDLYAQHETRMDAYEAMAEATLAPVREGARVCAAYYGHPGVFVSPSHIAMGRARAEGLTHMMLPGVSAEDCLFADMGVDPGRTGLQSYEARDFFLNARPIDPCTPLVLWQPAVVDEAAQSGFQSRKGAMTALAVALMETYPRDHEIVLYEASPCLEARARVERLALHQLGDAQIEQETTLFVPALGVPQRSTARQDLMTRAISAAQISLGSPGPGA
jgi:uroporphyrin-III C-methyltransferase